MSIAKNLKLIQEKINAAARSAGRDPASIRMIAVTKSHSVETIRMAYESGLKVFAENYIQEANQKMDKLRSLKIEWHFIGHIQSNKVKQAANRFSLIHSVDRIATGEKISQASVHEQDVLIEVNLAGEKSKNGCEPAQLPEILEKVQNLPRLRLRGLMFMPPFDLSIKDQIDFFLRARKLRDKMAKEISTPHSLVELSMGTSHDFEYAIREGATILRLGTALFGPREL